MSLARLSAALRSARLNRYWPDLRRLRAHLRSFEADFHQGARPEAEIDGRSGLPTYAAMQRAWTDQAVAVDALSQLPSEAALLAKPDSEVHARLLRRRRYYAALSGVKLAPLGDLTVKLRNQSGERCALRLVLDKLLAEGLYVRLTVDLEQKGADPGPLESALFRGAGLGAEATFIQAAALPEVRVERVVRGIIGPFHQADLSRRPGLPPGEILELALETAAVDQMEDRDLDPFADLMGEALGAEARASYEAARARYGYKVCLERQFVAQATLVDTLKQRYPGCVVKALR